MPVRHVDLRDDGPVGHDLDRHPPVRQHVTGRPASPPASLRSSSSNLRWSRSWRPADPSTAAEAGGPPKASAAQGIARAPTGQRPKPAGWTSRPTRGHHGGGETRSSGWVARACTTRRTSECVRAGADRGWKCPRDASTRVCPHLAVRRMNRVHRGDQDPGGEGREGSVDFSQRPVNSIRSYKNPGFCFIASSRRFCCCLVDPGGTVPSLGGMMV